MSLLAQKGRSGQGANVPDGAWKAFVELLAQSFLVPFSKLSKQQETTQPGLLSSCGIVVQCHTCAVFNLWSPGLPCRQRKSSTLLDKTEKFQSNFVFYTAVFWGSIEVSVQEDLFPWQCPGKQCHQGLAAEDWAPGPSDTTESTFCELDKLKTNKVCV